MLRNFRAFQMAKDYYRLCKLVKLPDYLREQLLRASSSIVLNLAEGSGKRTAHDQRRFYAIAFGSLRECQAIIEMEESETEAIQKQGDELAAVLYTLSRRTKAVIATTPTTATATATASAAAAASASDPPGNFYPH
jgi:four helix bundle protein